MKKRNFVCMMILICALLTGCQSTPEQDVIANKNDHQVRQTDVSQADSDTTSEDQSADGTEIVSEAISETFDADTEGVSINVQADEVKAHPVSIVYAEAKEISVDDVKRWSKAFYGTEDVYDGRNEMTKSEIEEAILWRQQAINDRESLIAEGYTEEEADSVIQLYKDEIKNLKAHYSEAIDNDEREKTDWTFRPASYYMKEEYDDDDNDEWDDIDQTEKLKVIGDCDGKRAYISASNRSTQDYQLHTLMFYWEDEDDGVLVGSAPSLSQEEAIQMTDEKLKELTDGTWKVNNVWSNHNQWHIRYIPILNDVPCVYSDIGYTSEDAYAANLEYEQIDFTLTDDKIVSAEWDSPMQITSTEDQSATLLSFNDIYQAFKNYMQVKCTLNSLGLATDDPEEDGVAGVQAYANITDISQMYCRVKVKNTDQSYQYVPTFVFSGYTSQGDYKEDDWVNQYCVVNAIDGTIINTWLGY